MRRGLSRDGEPSWTTEAFGWLVLACLTVVLLAATIAAVRALLW